MLGGRISQRAVFIARAGGCYILTRSWLRISACCPYTWKRPWLGVLFLGYPHSLRSFSEGIDILFHHLQILNMALKNTEIRFTSSFNSGKFFWFMFMNFFLLYLLDFLFQETNSLFHHLCHHISFESLRWCFSIFFASTEIISHLYSVAYSIFSHVYFVLSCSDLFISAVLVSFGSKSVSLVLQPFLLIYYLVFELVLLDSYWCIGSLRQPRRSPSWILFSHRLSSWGGPGSQGPPTRQHGQFW